MKAWRMIPVFLYVFSALWLLTWALDVGASRQLEFYIAVCERTEACRQADVDHARLLLER